MTYFHKKVNMRILLRTDLETYNRNNPVDTNAGMAEWNRTVIP